MAMSKADGWLIAGGGCTDRIEFWEGNLFLYSADPAKIVEAEEIVADFNCSRALR